LLLPLLLLLPPLLPASPASWSRSMPGSGSIKPELRTWGGLRTD
jgi:hypothetical protein